MKAGSYRATPRGRSMRGGFISEHSSENAVRSAGILCRICLQTLACVASLVLGFRFSRESLFVALHWSQSDVLYLSRAASEITNRVDVVVNDTDVALQYPYVPVSEVIAQKQAPLEKEVVQGSFSLNGSKSSRVNVGRHEILVRPWAHPDPGQMMIAHSLILRVQEEQRRLYGSTQRRRIIAITPTYARTFQAVYLTGLMHTLSHVPGPLTWIVVEAGGVSNETTELLAKSHLEVVHLGSTEPLPRSLEEADAQEAILRLEGLKHVRRNNMDGLIVFADEGNSYSLDFFEEVQSVKWFAAVSVGILQQAQYPESTSDVDADISPGQPSYPIQGPACSSSGDLLGWHAVKHSPEAVLVGYSDPVDTLAEWRGLEWAGFVLNSQIILKGSKKPGWLRSWEEWISPDEDVSHPVRIVKDEHFIEALGNCGRNVLVWWLRVEARADSKHPHNWVMDPPLEIVVPSKRTPWPDPPPPPPPLPPPAPAGNTQQREKRRKQPAKDSKSKGKSRREKRKHDQPQTFNEHHHGTGVSAQNDQR